MSSENRNRRTDTARALCLALGIMAVYLGHAGIALAQSQAINGTIEGSYEARAVNR